MSLPNCYRCGNQPCTCKDGCTIYHGDCREILPLLEKDSIDLVLTDPPYPKLVGGCDLMSKSTGVGVTRRKLETVGDIWNADFQWMSRVWDTTKLGFIVFCSYHSVDLVPSLIPKAKKNWVSILV